MFEIEDGIPLPQNEKEELVKKVKDELEAKRYDNVSRALKALLSEDDVDFDNKRRYVYRHIRGK